MAVIKALRLPQWSSLPKLRLRNGCVFVNIPAILLTATVATRSSPQKISVRRSRRMRYLFLIVLLILSGCSSKDARAKRHAQNYQKHYSLIIHAENRATPSARKVLQTARSMVVKGEIIQGACWDYLNTACRRAGYPYPNLQRVFTSTKRGPFASSDMLQPGDWVYHINHSYHNIEHSGMFIDWIDRNRRIALMLSYAGERRREPARYERYDLSHVYNIMRAVD